MVLKGRSMDWIQDRIHEAKIKHGVRAVFIDHLHFLVDMAKIRNPSLEIGAIVRGLKRIALELNVTIFLIAHLTKTKFEEEPELDAIRDSSFIPQDADQVYIVWRKYDTSAKEYLNQTYVKLCKSRRTGTMGKKVLLNYRFKLYFEEAKEYGEPERFEKRERYESRTLIDI
jgi:replicative DNA helicase